MSSKSEKLEVVNSELNQSLKNHGIHQCIIKLSMQALLLQLQNSLISILYIFTYAIFLIVGEVWFVGLKAKMCGDDHSQDTNMESSNDSLIFLSTPLLPFPLWLISK